MKRKPETIAVVFVVNFWIEKVTQVSRAVPTALFTARLMSWLNVRQSLVRIYGRKILERITG